MKRFILIICISILGFISNAQEKGWKFNVSFDPMVTWISANDNLKSDGSLIGFDFSLYAKKYFHERYAIYTGLSLMNMGGKVKNLSENYLKFNNFDLKQGYSSSIRVRYIAIPFGIKLHTAQFGLFSYYFNAGLYTGIRVGGSIKRSGETIKHSINKDVNLFTAGTQLGAGISYALNGGTSLKAGLKFNYSFVDALKTSALNGNPIGIGVHLGVEF